LKSNLAIYELAVGDAEAARRLYEQLLAERKLAFLRQTALPELCDFATIFPQHPHAESLSSDLISQVEALLAIYDLDKGGGMTHDMNDGSSRFSPMYCPLYGIHGLEDEKARAEKLLSQHADQRKTIIIWRLEGDWLYGQCNFKYGANDKFNLKFVDKLETVLNRNLEMFGEAGVNRFLFLEQELMDKFKEKRDADFDLFSLHYDLVQEEDSNLATAG